MFVSKYSLTFLLLTSVSTSALAQSIPQPPANTEELIVFGRALELIDEAKSASQGIVGYADFETRPLSRAGELVEVIPGVVATQHSGTGKANQYFLRGFNLDHGTDFAAFIDGTPINMRTHGHGQGYLDLNFIIPEIVERVEYRKGPYFADSGDFSAAGSAAFVTYDELDENFAELTVGEYGYLRAVGASSAELGKGNLLLAAEGQFSDGPWQLDENLEKFNGMVKFSQETGDSYYRVSLLGYDASWDSTDQIPLRAVESGLIDRFGFIDPDVGGETTRIGLSVDGRWSHDQGETALNAYAVSYDFTLWSNFTYFLDDPVNGDEFEQRDERWIYGGRLTHDRSLFGEDNGTSLLLGAEFRYDDIEEVGLYKTVGRQRLSTVRQDAVEEFSAALFAEVEVPLTDTLRATVGVRGDYYDVDVNAISQPLNNGSADDSLISPSLALAWRATEELEFYANYGQGFHSNDARGATINVDPVDLSPADRVDILVQAEGAELGARYERGPFNLSVAAFWLELDSELVFVGDAGGTEVNDATRRLGVEASAFWQVNDWLVLDASAAYTDAEFKDAPSDMNEIPGAVDTVFSAGAVFTYEDFTASLRVRHFGDAPLIEDGRAESDATTLVNLGTTYDIGRVQLGLDVYNLFDNDDADITYFYESRLPGESTGVEDIHFHPVEPRQVRASVRFRF